MPSRSDGVVGRMRGLLPKAFVKDGVAMGNMDSSDVVLLAMAGYLALMSLVRLMLRRRNQLMDEFRQEVADEKKRKKVEEQRQQHLEMYRRSA